MKRPACRPGDRIRSPAQSTLLCGLKADKERDDGDDKRRPETVLISPHQDAECHKAADMSLRQPTSTLDRYEPRIPRDLPLDTLPKKCSTPGSAD